MRRYIPHFLVVSAFISFLAPTGHAWQAAPPKQNLEVRDILGLDVELALRPSRGLKPLAPNRLLMIGEDGLLRTVEGEPTTCVTIDGRSVPCLVGSGGDAAVGTAAQGVAAGAAQNSALASGKTSDALKRDASATGPQQTGVRARPSGDVSTQLAATVSVVACTDTGTVNSIVCSVPNVTAYTRGMTVYAIPAAGNTGTVTINVNGLGSVAVTKNGSAALSGGELLTGAVAQLQYDGTRFQVLNGLPGWIDNGSVLTTLPGRTVKMGTTAPSSAPSGSLATGGNHYLPGSLGTGNVQAGGGVWGYGIFADSAGSATANSAISGAGSTVLGGASAMITGAPPSPGQIYWMSNWYCPVVGCDYFLRNGGSAGLWMNITDQGGNRGEGFAGDLIEVTAPAGTAGTHIPWIQSRHVYAATRHTVLGPFGTADNGVDTLQVVGSVAATSPGISCLQYPCKVGSISATYTATTSTIPLVSSTNGGLYRADYYLWSSSTYSGVGGTCTIQLAVSSNGTYGTSRTSTPILLTGASDINGSMVFQLGASGTIVGNVTIVAASPTGNCNIAISAQQVQ